MSKTVEPLPTETFLVDRSNLAFAGTAVTYGQGTGVVVATGDHTETGRIAGMLKAVQVLCRSLRLPMWRLGVFSNGWVWAAAVAMLAAQLLFTYAPFMNTLFPTEPLPAQWCGVLRPGRRGVRARRDHQVHPTQAVLW